MQTNNKLREALMQIYDRVNSLDENCAVDPVEIRDIAKAALAAQPRNCDVGTAEEQDGRYVRYCQKYRASACNPVCPLYKQRMSGVLCSLIWAQMPYVEKEGGAK